MKRNKEVNSLIVKKKEVKNKRGLFKGMLDLILFIGWILGTGIGGYFLGISQKKDLLVSLQQSHPCPKLAPIIQPREQVLTIPTELDCLTYLTTSGLGNDYEYLKKSWTCSRAKYNTSIEHEITNINLAKTKWKSVLSIDPDQFFTKYLTQYPGDMVITQPVVIFSHAPVHTLEDVSEKCTVLDIAIVPDRPGMCIAVTETYHDVASYHMLHAQQDSSGALTLASNSVRGRNIPTEKSYSIARSLLMDYFTFSSAISGAAKGLIIKVGNEKVTVIACLIEHKSEIELFKNSLHSYLAQGGMKDRIFTVSRHSTYTKELKSLGVKSIFASKATNVGKDLPPHITRGFMQIWFSFAATEVGAEVIWITPSTIWRVSPAQIIGSIPKDIETAWMFNGRRDPRAAPFFISIDFFFIRGGNDRSIHLLHEILVHADLLVEWDDMNALAAYRLTENNARYTRLFFLFFPFFFFVLLLFLF